MKGTVLLNCAGGMNTKVCEQTLELQAWPSRTFCLSDTTQGHRTDL